MFTYYLVGFALAVGQGAPAPKPAPAPAPAAAVAPTSATEPAAAPVSADLLETAEILNVFTSPIVPVSTESQVADLASKLGFAALEEAAGDASQVTVSIPPPAATPAPAADKDSSADASKEPKRRAMPSPFTSPPFPGSEYQGYPLIGVPADFTMWPMMKLLQGTAANDFLVDNKTRLYGWVTVEGNLSTSKESNTPESYWVRPNNVDMDQALIRVERIPDTVQTSSIDYGYRVSLDYGIDYRYFTAGGWFSEQLLKHNELYGWDPTEVYFDLYVPWVAQGLDIRVGRWIACPDIETQFSVDNYMGSHSILFTFDTYTQTGIMFTFKLSDQITAQAVLHSGTDMAPWYPGALPTGAFGLRWVAKDNNDAFYTWLNAINDAKFRYFEEYGQELGHDNFNYVVTTWEHRFNPMFITKTEAYIMWQRDAVVGGTPSAGPVEPFGGGGGLGAYIPGTTYDFGVLNYTTIELNKKDFITIRNEWYRDTDGERSGYPTTYTSNSIGYSHFITPEILIRPEIAYFHSWQVPAFDNGKRWNEVVLGCDFTIRF